MCDSHEYMCTTCMQELLEARKAIRYLGLKLQMIVSCPNGALQEQ